MTRFSQCMFLILFFAAPVSAQDIPFNLDPPTEVFHPTGVRLDLDWFLDPTFNDFIARTDLNRDGRAGGREDFQMLSDVNQQFGFPLVLGKETNYATWSIPYDINVDGRIDLFDLYELIALTEELHTWLVDSGRVDLGEAELPDGIYIQMPHEALAPLCLLQGDTNVDGCVTDGELEFVRRNVERKLGVDDQSATWRQGDFTGDGMVTQDDLDLCIAAWMRPCPNR